ncbi:MAG: hypothetical protein ACE5Z5_08225 [Candidatus Bathyarchaeia archaeon]
MGGKRDLESFERELEGYGDWRDAFRVALEGLANNVFARGLREIDETNLPTLKLRNPDAYEAIKNRKIREVLIVSGLFQVARHRDRKVVEDLEICWDTRPDIHKLLLAVVRLTEGPDSATPPEEGWPEQPYAGGEAVKVFIHSLDALIRLIGKGDWEKFNVLHKIAHGRGRTYGSPLDEIRIYAWHTPKPARLRRAQVEG